MVESLSDKLKKCLYAIIQAKINILAHIIPKLKGKDRAITFIFRKQFFKP
jgi:hypothetical protein